MRASPFEYHRARSLEHALDLLADLGEEARPLAGGQSLVPMMNFRLAQPSHLVDINDLPLGGITAKGEVIRVGGLVRHAELMADPLIARHLPALRDATRFIAHPTIRRRGTFGGSIAHADPTAELALMAVVYDATIVIASREGERRVKAEAFFESAFVTALRPGELIVAAEFPRPPVHSSGAFEEFSERQGDFAIVAVGVALALKDGRIEKARVACAGADLVPVRAAPVEAVLAGASLENADVTEAAVEFAESREPPSDLRATAEYRRALIAELTRRAVSRAVARAAETG